MGRIHHKKSQFTATFPRLANFFPQNNRYAPTMCINFYLGQFSNGQCGDFIQDCGKSRRL